LEGDEVGFFVVEKWFCFLGREARRRCRHFFVLFESCFHENIYISCYIKRNLKKKITMDGVENLIELKAEEDAETELIKKEEEEEATTNQHYSVEEEGDDDDDDDEEEEYEEEEEEDDDDGGERMMLKKQQAEAQAREEANRRNIEKGRILARLERMANKPGAREFYYDSKMSLDELKVLYNKLQSDRNATTVVENGSIFLQFVVVAIQTLSSQLTNYISVPFCLDGYDAEFRTFLAENEDLLYEIYYEYESHFVDVSPTKKFMLFFAMHMFKYGVEKGQMKRIQEKIEKELQQASSSSPSSSSKKLSIAELKAARNRRRQKESEMSKSPPLEEEKKEEEDSSEADSDAAEKAFIAQMQQEEEKQKGIGKETSGGNNEIDLPFRL
jgi:hypothetical protein